MENVVIAPEHLAFETLPFPVLVLRQGRVVYVNPAWQELIGMERHVAVGQLGSDMILNGIDPKDRAWLLHHYVESERLGHAPPTKLWLHVLSPSRGSPLIRLVYGPGLNPEDQVFSFLDANDEERARNLTHELVKGAASLLHHRDERELLEAALDVLAQQQLTCAVFFVEGDSLRPGPWRQHPDVRRALKEARGDGQRLPAYPRALLPHLAEIERTRRAMFLQDLSIWCNVTFPPAVLSKFHLEVRNHKGLDAPLFVDQQLHAFLCVQSPELTPAEAAAIELFATHVGAALENARTHQEASARFEEVQRLQQQIIARERLSVLGEAAAVMAHEMQNPLGVILNGVSLLKSRPPEEGAIVLKMMEEEARSLERLARDLLSWAKPFSANFSLLPVSELLQEAALQMAATDSPRIQVGPCDEVLRLWGDGYLLKLALSNLLRNAVQASPPGAPVQLWAEKADGAQAIRLIVEDRGRGVPEALRQRIFEPFFTSRAQGSGLGLALVARVIKAHSGEVRVLDAQPQGARFEVELPLPGHFAEFSRRSESDREGESTLP